MPIPDVIAGKKIAFVSNSAWSVYNFRLDTIRYLLDNNVKVIVLAAADEYASKLVSAGCIFYPLSVDNRSVSPFNDLSFYFRLRAIYNRLRPDFIFHYVAKPNIYGSLAAAAVNIPSVAVITGLGYPFAKRNWLFHVMKFLYKKAMTNAREAWFLNNDDAQVFVSEKIVAISKVKVLPGEGVNTDHFRRSGERHRASGEPFRFIMSTRLLKSKGVAIYADAARIVRKKKYPVQFSLIGFPEKGHPDLIDKSSLAEWQNEGLINYLGFAEDVRPFMNEADCLVFPSYYNEGVPRCLMEAASMELPAITTANRGCTEVVQHNVNGLICRANDPFDLADKMEQMMKLSEQQLTAMGRKGRELAVEKFDVRKILAEYANTLISAFENHHGSNR